MGVITRINGMGWQVAAAGRGLYRIVMIYEVQELRGCGWSSGNTEAGGYGVYGGGNCTGNGTQNIDSKS